MSPKDKGKVIFIRFQEEIKKCCFVQKFTGEEQKFEVMTISVGCKQWFAVAIGAGRDLSFS